MSRALRLRVAAAAAVVSAACVGVPAAWAGDDTLPPDLLAPQSGLVTLTGTLTEGPECTAIRGDSGAVYSLVIANRGGLQLGDHVRISGHLAEASVCMNGPTIVVDHIEATTARDIIVK